MNNIKFKLVIMCHSERSEESSEAKSDLAKRIKRFFVCKLSHSE